MPASGGGANVLQALTSARALGGGYFYAIVNHLQPGSFALGGAVVSPPLSDLLYFSFTVRTSTGFGDMVPVLRYASAPNCPAL